MLGLDKRMLSRTKHAQCSSDQFYIYTPPTATSWDRDQLPSQANNHLKDSQEDTSDLKQFSAMPGARISPVRPSGRRNLEKDISKQYKVLEKLGSGGYGACFAVRHRVTGTLYVDKVEKRPSKEGFSQEIDILLKLQKDTGSERIVQMLKYISEPYDVQIFLEYCTGGDLYDLIKELDGLRGLQSPRLVSHVAIQLAEALAYCHEGAIIRNRKIVGYERAWTGIIHRDIKPENVFLRTPFRGFDEPFPDFVLGDFGLATTEKISELVSTPDWAPPELPLQTMDSDVWSVGAVMHRMACGKTPISRRPWSYSGHDWTLESEARSVTPMPSCYPSLLNQRMMRALELNRRERVDTISFLRALWFSDHEM